MTKEPRSFSIDEDLNELLSERDDLNASGAVNSFLREYLAGGRGAEAAIEVRLSQLDEEIAELEKELTRKTRERERLQDRREERQTNRDEAVGEMVSRIENNNFTRENLSPENLAIQNWASEAGIEVERFVDSVKQDL